METLLMNCKSHLYKVIHNHLLESIITIHTQYNNIMNKQQIYSTIFKRLIVPDLSIFCFCSKIINNIIIIIISGLKL
jgi:hypothetical protein